MRRAAIGWFLTVGLLTGSAVSGLATEQTTAVVRGADSLYVRRGPDKSYPAFSTLSRGEEVAVEAIVGSWALIQTASGERGYVHAAYLDLPPGADLSHTEPTKGIVTPTPAEDRSEDARRQELEQQVESLREGLAGLQLEPNVPEGTPQDSQRGDADLQVDLQRLLRLTEELHAGLTTRQTPGVTGEPAPGLVGSPGAGAILAVAGVGLLIGLVLGSAYGRHKERKRRTRVRF